jgi:hypothetical protein
MGKYPINPLKGIGAWLICYILGCGPSIFIIETIVTILVVLCIPISVSVVLTDLFLRGTGPVLEFCQVIDGKGYNRVVTIKVNIKRGAGRDCPDDEEGKKQENDSEQVAKAMRYWLMCAYRWCRWFVS